MAEEVPVRLAGNLTPSSTENRDRYSLILADGQSITARLAHAEHTMRRV